MFDVKYSAMLSFSSIELDKSLLDAIVCWKIIVSTERVMRMLADCSRQ